jgi:hypothetical protein
MTGMAEKKFILERFFRGRGTTLTEPAAVCGEVQRTPVELEEWN